MSLQEYRDFIAARAGTVSKHGFEPNAINAKAKKHQDVVIRFALETLIPDSARVLSSWSFPASAQRKPANPR